MDKILVTTDLSPVSEAGIRFAISLSKQMKATLIFYYVSHVTKPTAWSPKRYRAYKESNINENKIKLENFVKKVSGTKWGLIQESEFSVGLSLNAGRSIVAFAKEKKVKYICMSTHGAGGLKKLIGTNTSYVITKSLLPVFTIPVKYQPKPFKRILFACDFISLSNELNTVKQIAGKLNSKILVAHYESYHEKPDHKTRLREAALKNQTKNIIFQFKRVRIDGSFSEYLDKDIARIKPSLVIMFTKKNRNWFSKLLARNETKQLSFRSTVPILAFKKKEN